MVVFVTAWIAKHSGGAFGLKDPKIHKDKKMNSPYDWA